MAERRALAAILRREDKIRNDLEDVLAERDGLIRSLRWGLAGQDEVMPDALISATRCARYPDGLSRTTIHRIVGRLKDRPTTAQDDGLDHDEQEH